MHTFQIYNKQVKKETIDTLLVGNNIDTWRKVVGDELGRITNQNENQLRAKNTFKFIRKKEVPRGRTFTYAIFLCDYRPLKL